MALRRIAAVALCGATGGELALVARAAWDRCLQREEPADSLEFHKQREVENATAGARQLDTRHLERSRLHHPGPGQPSDGDVFQ